MSDFEQWIQQNSFGVEHANGDIDLVVSTGDIRKYWQAAKQSMQGEAVGVVTLADDISQPDTSGEHKGKYQNMIYSSAPLQVGARVFTYPPSASAEIARLNKELEEARKDAERYRAIKENVEEIRVAPRNSSSSEFGFDDIRMKWQIKAHMPSYTCVGEAVSFDDASDMLVAAIRQIGGGE